MCRVLRVDPPITFEIVRTDDPDFPTYRRNQTGAWENLMGESWETVYTTRHLERAYQEYMKQRKEETE